MASEGLDICEIPEDLLKKLKTFRFMKPSKVDKNKVAWILKIVPKEIPVSQMEQTEESGDNYTYELKVEEEIVKHDNDEFIDEDFIENKLPAQPRFILISSKCKKDDGRVLYPQIIIHYNPTGMKPELKMLYRGTLHQLQEASGMKKVTVVQDSEEMSDEWLNEELLRFK